ncbi:GNAT family N-acetyltransferase [Actinokineospora sp. PR83]|uniref:GNAT family N-acetyltransferase n=1 Tax=Actinokineospora sp. PR83 TaxID=2884908 RepID=UPI001F2CB284|nr:GNAT family N-acetyltransferase [Actinokineospora sp. PR83]MCG8918268.1 GNAT family N-acetyltransferase [Actinokineospora sp. PR83]
MSGFLIRPAMPTECDVVLGLLFDRALWLHQRGSDQWSRTSAWPKQMSQAIDAGHTWILFGIDQVPMATITLSTSADSDFWSAAEREAPAMYLSKLATATFVRGGLGARVLQWAVDYAFRQGHHPVRVDVWKTAYKLHKWYESQGWTKLRTVEVPGRMSGTLFERAAEPCMVPEFATVEQAVPRTWPFTDDE